MFSSGCLPTDDDDDFMFISERACVFMIIRSAYLYWNDFQRGPNKVPIYSMVVVAIVTVTFIIIGDINILAPIVTMPFLITYASIDYSYFALAQTFDLQHKREMRYDFIFKLFVYFL